MWAHLVNTALGLWLMAAPGLFGYETAAADSGHIVGPVIVTFSVTALWECTRGMRKWNCPLAAWLLIAPWVLGYDSVVAIVSDMSCGVLVFVFSSIRGEVSKKYGGGWSVLFNKHSPHENGNH